MKKIILFLVLLFFIIGCVKQEVTTDKPTEKIEQEQTQTANPASVYCKEQNGRLEIRSDEAGNQYGVCIFDDFECEEWAYYKRECPRVEQKQAIDWPITEEIAQQEPEPKLLIWEKEPGIRIPEAVSSSTIFRDDKYWMYYTRNGIELAISDDGINFEEKGIVIRDDGIGSDQEMVTNPAVFGLKNGKYRMIYEGSKDRQTVRKLYSAISDDGAKWTKEEGIKLEDSIFFSDPKKGKSGNVIFTSVPDAIRLENGCLRMYYTAIDESRIAESCDEGLTWAKMGKIIFDSYLDVVQDPDIIQLEDGTYRLFFSTQDLDRTKQWILTASSEDGINFKLDGGKRIEPSSGKARAVDPDVIKLAGKGYRMYYGESKAWEDFDIMSAISIS